MSMKMWVRQSPRGEGRGARLFLTAIWNQRSLTPEKWNGTEPRWTPRFPRRPPQSPASFSEQPKQQRQNQADQQTGDDREMETEILPRAMNVARQPPTPAQVRPRPSHKAGHRQHDPDDKQKFAELTHRVCTFAQLGRE